MIRPSRSRAPSMSQISPRRTPLRSVDLRVHHRDLAFVGQRVVLVDQPGPANRLGVGGEDLAQRALACGLVDPGGEGDAVALGPAPGIGDRLVREGQGHLGGHTGDRTGDRGLAPYRSAAVLASRRAVYGRRDEHTSTRAGRLTGRHRRWFPLRLGAWHPPMSGSVSPPGCPPPATRCTRSTCDRTATATPRPTATTPRPRPTTSPRSG